MTIKAVIFDMDGVLTESMCYHIESWNYAFNNYGINPTSEDLSLLEGMSYKETIDVLSKKYSVKLSQSQKDELYLIKKKKISEIMKFNIYSGVMKLLVDLKNLDVNLAVVSGANKELINSIIGKHFNSFFDIVISGTDVENGKPNPEPYLKALDKLNIKSEEAIVIENAPLGIKSSKGAKIKTFALTTTLKRDYLKEADMIFDKHEDLSKYLLSMIR